MKHTDLQSVLTISAVLILGLAIGIGLCKLAPGFLGWVMGGIL